MYRFFGVIFLTFSVLTWGSFAHARAESLSFEGVSRPTYNAELSFSVPGSVYAIPVERGQAVKKGDLLMHLDARAEDSRLAQLNYEIQSTIKLRTLGARVGQAKLDMNRFRNALRKNAATRMELQHAELGHTLSVLALEEEKFRLEQLKHSRNELLALREKMFLYAPYDGYIEDISVSLGMAVDRNVSAMRLVVINPLLVELTVPIEQALQLNVGDTVEVIQPDSVEVLEGKVAFIAKIAVLSSKTLKVHIHVPNAQGLPAGLLVTVRFPAKP